MAIGKKGIFFTLTAIMFVVILISFVKIKYSPKMSEKIDVTNYRISTMDSFVTSVEEDIERALYITSFRALLVITDFVRERAEGEEEGESYYERKSYAYEFTDNITKNLEDAIYYGKDPKGDLPFTLSSSKWTDWTLKINEEAKKLNIATEFGNPIVVVYQDNPWSVKVNLNVTITYSDMDGFASWKRDTVVIAELNLSNFEDPSYNVITGCKAVYSTIRETPYEDNYTYTIGEGEYQTRDAKHLADHLKNGYYARHNDAPSYISRLEGHLSNTDEWGIERLVYFSDLEQYCSYYDNLEHSSIVDHKYQDLSSVCRTHSDLPNNFIYLDSSMVNNHHSKYGVIAPIFQCGTG